MMGMMRSKAMFLWGKSIDFAAEHVAFSTKGRGVAYELGVARWAGHRRWPVRKWCSWQSRWEPPKVQLPLWYPSSGHLTAIPNLQLGAGTPPRRSPERAMVRARFPAGRWWRVRIHPGQPWAVLRVQLSTLMNRDIGSFSIWYQGARVREEDAIPPDAEDIDLHRVNRAGVPPVRAGEEPEQAQRVQGPGDSPPRHHAPLPEGDPVRRARSRSRTPARGRDIRQGAPVQEDDDVMVEYPTTEGTFRLGLRLEDTQQPTWQQVTAGHVEAALLRTYPQVFFAQPRIALAANRTCLRATEHVQPWLDQQAELVVIPNQYIGTNGSMADETELNDKNAQRSGIADPMPAQKDVPADQARSHLHVQHMSVWTA